MSLQAAASSPPLPLNDTIYNPFSTQSEIEVLTRILDSDKTKYEVIVAKVKQFMETSVQKKQQLKHELESLSQAIADRKTAIENCNQEIKKKITQRQAIAQVVVSYAKNFQSSILLINDDEIKDFSKQTDSLNLLVKTIETWKEKKLSNEKEIVILQEKTENIKSKIKAMESHLTESKDQRKMNELSKRIASFSASIKKLQEPSGIVKEGDKLLQKDVKVRFVLKRTASKMENEKEKTSESSDEDSDLISNEKDTDNEDLPIPKRIKTNPENENQEDAGETNHFFNFINALRKIDGPSSSSTRDLNFDAINKLRAKYQLPELIPVNFQPDPAAFEPKSLHRKLLNPELTPQQFKNLISQYADSLDEEVGGWVPLHILIWKGNFDLLEIFCKQQSHLKIVRRINPFQLVAIHPSMNKPGVERILNCFKSIEKVRKEISRFFLSTTAAPFHLATCYGNYHTLEAMIDFRRVKFRPINHVSQFDEHGFSPLHLTAFDRNYDRVAQVLLDSEEIEPHLLSDNKYKINAADLAKQNDNKIISELIKGSSIR